MVISDGQHPIGNGHNVGRGLINCYWRGGGYTVVAGKYTVFGETNILQLGRRTYSGGGEGGRQIKTCEHL